MLLDRIVKRHLPFALALWLTLLAGAGAETGLGGGGVGSTGLGWNRGGTSVTNDQQFIMVDNTPDASAERALTGSSTITITDNGANGSIVLSVNGPLIPTSGGTGTATTTVGDLLVGAASNTWAKLGLGGALEVLRVNAAGTGLEYAAAGTGSVTDFSAGDLSPLFTTSEANTTTTPALTFSLSDAAANTVLGNFTGSPAGPTYGTVTIAAGGTGQTAATAAFDALAPTTTAGDLIAHNGTDNIRVALGTGNQVLGVNNGGTAHEYKTITAGTNISVAHGANTITINNTDPNNGTVTNYSAGDLSPLFTTTEANTTTTPALSFDLTDAAAYTVLGRHTGSSGDPSYGALTASHLPQAAKIMGGAGGASSVRTIPTSGTITGEFWMSGPYATSGPVTCNRCRLHVDGTVTISHAITVNTELSGGIAGGTATSNVSGTGGGLGGGGGAVSFDSTSNTNGGAGGSFGGIGGAGGAAVGDRGPRSGTTYTILHSLSGSGGGGGSSGASATPGGGGAGGGGFYLEATGAITIDADITADGAAGAAGGATAGAGGGGSGGGVDIRSLGTVTINAGRTIFARGGAGGNDADSGGASDAGGGGGAGGYVAVHGSTVTNNGTITVTGGAAGGGSDGTAATAGAAGVSLVESTVWHVRTAP